MPLGKIMPGYSRLGNGRPNGNVKSPVSSPPASPRFRHGRIRAGGRGTKPESFWEKVLFSLISSVFRRRGFLLFAPLLYIFGMFMYMGTLNFEVPVKMLIHRAPQGSHYRSPEVFKKLWPSMQVYGNTTDALLHAWQPREGGNWLPCVNRSLSHTDLPTSNGYLIIEANGGLNQQRISICDVVPVAKLLNATLVIPMFHLNSVWRDSSKFGDIFDEEYFIDSLKNHVRVVKELPEDVLQQFDYNISSIVNLRVKAWSSPHHYMQKVLPKLNELGAVRIAPFSNRLAHAVPPHLQALRCLANYQALRFSQPIRTLGEKMVERMVTNSSLSGGKYISIHLRFEKDMVAFSCCTYDGGEEEKHEMDIARERGWRGKFNKTGRVIKPGRIRMDGKCPLTPLEVGMMLRGMGFDNSTYLYVAAGKMYKSEKYMAPLRQLFPNLETKDTLASQEELAPFKNHSSRLAALDYTVCLHSEVFVTTQGGNFPHFLMGHRRYLYRGHSKTIIPDKRKLALLFDNPKIRWDHFRHQMKEMLRHSDSKGIEVRKPSKSLYTFPMPDCMCQRHADARTGEQE
ncbi:O-fucosyltransferase 9-like [Aristolochia californica]|uniref:O-fucosyltransferase 9-like n=1 Tax=Aristolochia californica TaxID=171875 RepID=UPI0035DCB302